MMPQKSVVLLGHLARPHSITGEVRLHYYAESPLLLDENLYLKAGDSSLRPVKLESWRVWKGQPVIRLPGINDRTAAELLRGQELFIDRASFPEVEQGQTYIKDLIGLQVFVDGQTFGALTEVSFPADREIWHILTPAGQEVLFPARPEFVLDIDLNAGIHIAPPPGLLEIYLEQSPDL